MAVLPIRTTSGEAWPFVGRAAELEAAVLHLDAGGAGVLVTGPAGIGKTRFLEELGRALAGRGRGH